MPIAFFPLGEEFHLPSGIWTATSGAIAQSENLDVIANNLANADTPAFKKDLPTFKEYLATQERERTPEDIPRGPVKDSDLYRLDGRDQSNVVLDGVHTNFKQGPLKVTHRPFDISLDGPGFLEISTPAGIRYTREGSLKIGADGRLVTTSGFPVLSTGSAGIATAATPPPSSNPAGRFINLRDMGTEFSINEQGELFAKDDLVAKLSVVEFKDTAKLRKTGGSLFEAVGPNSNFSTNPPSTVIHSGTLEMSNVNPIEEIANMIKANRIFEQDLKSLKTYGELLGKEANEIGKL